MKRMFAMLLAALLALTGGAAWAEEFPSITVTGAMTVDLETARAVLEGLELGEEHASLLEGLLSRLDGSRDSLVLADEGFQYDVTLEDGAALSFAGEKTGDGFAVVSTLFPNYILVSADPGCDWDQASAASRVVTGGLERLMEEAAMAFTPGEAEAGAFELFGKAYDARTPLDVDVAALAERGNAFIAEIAGALPEAWRIPGFDGEQLPAVTGAMYTAADREDVVYAAEITLRGADAPGWSVALQQDGDAVYLNIDAPDRDLAFALDYIPGEGGVYVWMDLTRDGRLYGLSVETQAEGDVTAMTTKLYAPDGETVILTEENTFADGGERTLEVSGEGRLALDLDAVAAGDTGATAGLLMDILLNGLPGATPGDRP